MTLDRRSFLFGSAAAGFFGCTGARALTGETDENLTVFVSDVHVSGRPEDAAGPRKRLERFVDEVLAMRPRPRRVVCLGDIAYLWGLPEDYATSKPIFSRLEAAGVELVFCMGNHDRRSAFGEAWPEHLKLSPVPGRAMRVVSLGTADLVVLDALQGADDRPRNDMGPGAGPLFEDEFAWMKDDLPNRKRPFFVCSHFPIGGVSCPAPKGKKPVSLATWLLRHAPMCKGYLHGHDHRWRPEWSQADWKSPKVLRTLCLPSNGLWGDIGHAVFRTFDDRAVCSLEIRDFFFPREPETDERPVAWRIKTEENRGQKVTFSYL